MCVDTVAKTPGEKPERILDKRNWCLQAKAVKKSRLPVTKKILSEGTRQKAK